MLSYSYANVKKNLKFRWGAFSFRSKRLYNETRGQRFPINVRRVVFTLLIALDRPVRARGSFKTSRFKTFPIRPFRSRTARSVESIIITPESLYGGTGL